MNNTCLRCECVQISRCGIFFRGPFFWKANLWEDRNPFKCAKTVNHFSGSFTECKDPHCTHGLKVYWVAKAMCNCRKAALVHSPAFAIVNAIRCIQCLRTRAECSHQVMCDEHNRPFHMGVASRLARFKYWVLGVWQKVAKHHRTQYLNAKVWRFWKNQP